MCSAERSSVGTRRSSLPDASLRPHWPVVYSSRAGAARWLGSAPAPRSSAVPAMCPACTSMCSALRPSSSLTPRSAAAASASFLPRSARTNTWSAARSSSSSSSCSPVPCSAAPSRGAFFLPCARPQFWSWHAASWQPDEASPPEMTMAARAARCTGVRPRWSTAEGSPPSSSRRASLARSSSCTARCMSSEGPPSRGRSVPGAVSQAITPLRFLAVRSAPRPTSSWQNSTWPFCAAKWRGVAPY
mmetsp:Transcript_25800/g.65343  ORF Transcript_25800/g.65343 Transcript_25800/m.65343 type:complete len:245 (-) Transcript_25800:272-1006(-)